MPGFGYGVRPIARRRRVASGTPAPTPTPTPTPTATALPQSASIIARWSPDAIASPPADGTPLSSYADAVNGIALVQAAGANQPLFKTNGAGGKPYLLMSGSSQMRVATNPTIAAGLASGRFTMMAFYRNAIGTTTGVIVQAKGAGEYFATASTSAKADDSTYGCAFGGIQFGHNGSVGSTDIQSIGIIRGTGVGNNFHADVLNGCIITMNDAAYSAQDGSFGIGYQTPTSSYRGELYDVIIWSVPLTAVEALQAQKWACEKYGQTPRWVTSGKLTIGGGDSQMAGLVATRPQTDNFFCRAAKAIGMPIGTWINVGQSGRRTGLDLAPYAVAALDPIPALVGAGVAVNHVFLEYYNIRTDTAPTPQAQNLAYCAARKAAGFNKIGLLTGYDDKDHSAGRAQYITDLIAGYAASGVSDLIRVDLDPNIGVVGSCPSASPFGTYFADGIHLTTAGNGVTQGVAQPVIAGW